MTNPASAATAKAALTQVAGYRYRAVAALLDALVLYALIVVISWSWLAITAPQSAMPEAPYHIAM